MLSTRALVFLSVHPYIEVFEMIVGKLNHDAVTVVTMAGGGAVVCKLQPLRRGF